MVKVNFGTINSYDDLNLFLKKVTITSAEPKRMTVDVPCRNGELDLTNAISEEIAYRNREMTLYFSIADYNRMWMSDFSVINNQIHGRKLRVVISNDPDWYWDAFCTVDSTEDEWNRGDVVVKCVCYPYKRHDYSVNVTATSSGKNVSIEITKETVIPEITTNAAITIKKGTKTFSFSSGTSKNTGLRLTEGTNSLKVTGSATVTIAYTDGSL